MLQGWVVDLLQQCKHNEVPFHFKQWGLSSNNPDPKNDDTDKVNGGSAKGGRKIFGTTYNEEPRWLPIGGGYGEKKQEIRAT